MTRPPQFTPFDAGFTMLTGLMEAARIIPEAQKAKDNSLPLTILSGFLGAGKTTLVNRLLAEPEGRRIVVLVNDFGSLDIDASLIRSRSATTISLANGCACCTVAGDLARALVELAQKPEPPDAILLEASGLADPHGIAQVALANPALRLDGVVTIVDAETLALRASDADIAALFKSQIAAADLLVLNKIDLLGTGALRAREALAALAGDKPIVDAEHACVPASVVFGIDSDRDRAAPAPDDTTHRRNFRSWSIKWSRPLARDRIEAALSALPRSVLRAKGVLHLAGEAPPHVYHRVGARWAFSPAEPGVREGDWSRLVIIGLASEAEAIAAAVERLKNA